LLPPLLPKWRKTGASPARISPVTMGGSNKTKCNILWD
jgi:hypothetical protein